jgi:hypothetical protein
VSRDLDYAHETGQHDGTLAADGARARPQSARLTQAAGVDARSMELVQRLLGIAVAYLPHAHTALDFAFRLDGSRAPDGAWRLTKAGRSPRYGAICALGLLRLPEAAQRQVLDGATADDLIGHLGSELKQLTSLGDVALVCWAAAEAGHAVLPRALSRLAELDRADQHPPVVDSAWVVSALVAARSHADVEEHLHRARQRLITARGPGAYPHLTGPGSPWHRAHVGSFADQIYPVQALARLHASSADPAALEVANAIAGAICDAQGEAGQWWWHYDSRNGRVVEGYPVYSVHQHAMAPMGLLDLADAGGDNHLDAICRGLRWLEGPPETTEALVLDDPPVAWRKVARSDAKKLVRGARAASTRIHPQLRLSPLDQMFRPGKIDHECRPYELGWLPVAWLS